MFAACSTSPVQTRRAASTVAPTTCADASCMPSKVGLSGGAEPALLDHAGAGPCRPAAPRRCTPGRAPSRPARRRPSAPAPSRRPGPPPSVGEHAELAGQQHGEVDPDRGHRVAGPEVVVGERRVEHDAGGTGHAPTLPWRASLRSGCDHPREHHPLDRRRDVRRHVRPHVAGVQPGHRRASPARSTSPRRPTSSRRRHRQGGRRAAGGTPRCPSAPASCSRSARCCTRAPTSSPR